MASSTAKTVDLALPREVDVPRPGDVAEYLRHYPDIGRLLPRVCEAVLDRFGDRAQVVLDVYRDPEADDEYLAIEVRQEVYEAGTLRAIEGVSRGFEEELSACNGWLLVTTDFRPPVPHR